MNRQIFKLVYLLFLIESGSLFSQTIHNDWTVKKYSINNIDVMELERRVRLVVKAEFRIEKSVLPLIVIFGNPETLEQVIAEMSRIDPLIEQEPRVTNGFKHIATIEIPSGEAGNGSVPGGSKEKFYNPMDTSDSGIRHFDVDDNGNFVVFYYGQKSLKKFSPSGKLLWERAAEGHENQFFRCFARKIFFAGNMGCEGAMLDEEGRTLKVWKAGFDKFCGTGEPPLEYYLMSPEFISKVSGDSNWRWENSMHMRQCLDVDSKFFDNALKVREIFGVYGTPSWRDKKGRSFCIGGIKTRSEVRVLGFKDGEIRGDLSMGVSISGKAIAVSGLDGMLYVLWRDKDKVRITTFEPEF